MLVQCTHRERGSGKWRQCTLQGPNDKPHKDVFSIKPRGGKYLSEFTLVLFIHRNLSRLYTDREETPFGFLTMKLSVSSVFPRYYHRPFLTSESILPQKRKSMTIMLFSVVSWFSTVSFQNLLNQMFGTASLSFLKHGHELWSAPTPTRHSSSLSSPMLLNYTIIVC